MIRLYCDYAEGAHPAVLEKLSETNFVQTEGYGQDKYCDQAREMIKELCACETADVHFLVGGTQTNLTVIASALRAHEGVVAAESGHITTHETGAIEACGHKVLALPAVDGKISAAQVENLYLAHMADENHEHTVKPGMVYISNPTEFGTIYSLDELTALSQVCRKYGMPLFLDGARLGYGLAAEDNTLSFELLAQLCDVFYIGGTKQGALFGEAVVITNDKLKSDFRYFIKQKGGMLAKGRLLGLQFLALLENDLYMTLSRHADTLAGLIRDAVTEAGFTLNYPNKTNQVFATMPDSVLDELAKDYTFSPQERVDENHRMVRFCVSWAAKRENIEKLARDIVRLGK